MKPDEASVQDAFMEGQRAGAMLFGAPLNPYQDNTPEHAAWERGRMGALGQAMARSVC